MKKIAALVLFVFIGIIAFISPSTTLAQEQQQTSQPPKEELMKGEVTEIFDSGEKTIEGKSYPYQNIKVKLLDGVDKDKIVAIKHGDQVTLREDQKVTVGEK